MTEGDWSAVPIRAVWFDVGETLIDESREYGTWADWLGVPRHTFSAVFGAVIARGGDYREVFQHFRPGFDLAIERQARLDAEMGEYLNGQDLYPDVRPCLQALKAAGYFVGIAGNQTARAGRFLHELNLPCDVLATSDDWGVAKPDVEFFDKLVAVSGHNRDEIAYIGDRLDKRHSPRRPSWPLHHLAPARPGYILGSDELPMTGSLPDAAPTPTVRALTELVAELASARDHAELRERRA
jgi:FMN phosphatase YigB (HAD superfamily)